MILRKRPTILDYYGRRHLGERYNPDVRTPPGEMFPLVDLRRRTLGRQHVPELPVNHLCQRMLLGFDGFEMTPFTHRCLCRLCPFFVSVRR